MAKKLDSNTCRHCKREVGKGGRVCCCCFSVWYHFECSGLSKTEFENNTKNKNLHWSFPDYVVYRCGKCAKVIGKKNCVFFAIAVISDFMKSVLFWRQMSLKH